MSDDGTEEFSLILAVSLLLQQLDAQSNDSRRIVPAYALADYARGETFLRTVAIHAMIRLSGYPEWRGRLYRWDIVYNKITRLFVATAPVRRDESDDDLPDI
jgi:hypothetical protein